MPFYEKINYKDVNVLLWKYAESDVFNEKRLIESDNVEKIQNYHPKKKAEYLMIRQLKELEYPNYKILYKSQGQPYLQPQDAYISVTHSYPFAGLAISKSRVGLDFELVQPKIEKIKDKFLHPNEHKWIDNAFSIEYLTIIWAIKEALYKLHPSKYWSLKKHYEVFPFELNNLDEVSCRIFDEHFEDCYTAKVMAIENYYLAIIQENHEINYKIP